MDSGMLYSLLGQAMQNPSINANPDSRAVISAIMSGDEDRMRAMAQSMCEKSGMTMQDALDQAHMKFNL